MKKAICPICKNLIEVDETVLNIVCPKCNHEISSSSAIKVFRRSVAYYNHKANTMYNERANYQLAFLNYEHLHSLLRNDLETLTMLVKSKLRSSTLNKLTIKEACDLLLQESENIVINLDNVKLLSDFLIDFKNDANAIVIAYQKYKPDQDYELALNEYKYFLSSYLNIYQSLDKVNKYFKEGLTSINSSLSEIDSYINNVHSREISSSFDSELIFPSNGTHYFIHIALYVLTAIGAILSCIGLILLSVLKNELIIQAVILSVGLILFIGGYFINHYLTYTKVNKKIK